MAALEKYILLMPFFVPLLSSIKWNYETKWFSQQKIFMARLWGKKNNNNTLKKFKKI